MAYMEKMVSDFMTIINDCIQLNRRQTNGIAYSLAKKAPHNTSLHIYHNTPRCISTLINNKKL